MTLAAPPTRTITDSSFHLLSVQTTNTIMVDSIAMDRNCNSGGERIGAFLAYDRLHTAEDLDYIQKVLMHKWFGAPACDRLNVHGTLAAGVVRTGGIVV